VSTPAAAPRRPRPDARLTAAVVAGQLAATLSRRLGRGGGTTLPGRVTSLVDPDSLAKIAAQLRDGSLVVTGTNGKTTTTRLIANLLRAEGRRVVHNRSGANLISGVASALIAATHPDGRPLGDVGLFEVDEASVPAVVAAIKPRVLAVTNLFRDQLDRYGEVTFVANSWRRAIEQLPSNATLVLNADDPSVAALGRGAPGRTIYVGVDDRRTAGSVLEHTADARLCPWCGGRLEYDAVFYGHVGHYRCPACDFLRPTPEVRAERVDAAGADGSQIILGDGTTVTVPLPGLYNVYNTLVGIGVADALGLDRARALDTVSHFSAAFGRIERVPIGDRQLYMALVKNPVGFNQVLRSVVAPLRDADVLIAINDNLADGTDVSWLWDVDVDPLIGSARRIWVTGSRCGDMRLRLKYGGVDDARIELVPSGTAALDRALDSVPSGGTLYAMPTYTAMLELRAELARRGLVAPFWED
jgi:UDP-N-acetylmuramyl tripeptide synthase